MIHAYRGPHLEINIVVLMLNMLQMLIGEKKKRKLLLADMYRIIKYHNIAISIVDRSFNLQRIHVKKNIYIRVRPVKAYSYDYPILIVGKEILGKVQSDMPLKSDRSARCFKRMIYRDYVYIQNVTFSTVSNSTNNNQRIMIRLQK